MQLNKKYMLSLRNIVKTDDGYVLQKVYKENENGEIVETLENKNNENSNGFIKNCYMLHMVIIILIITCTNVMHMNLLSC